MEKNDTINIKIIMIGESGVGKTSLLMRFIDGKYKENRETIGIDLKSKILTIHNKQLKLQIWDTAGQERFRSISKSYFRKIHGVVYVFDINNINSFTQLFDIWIKEKDNYTTDKYSHILVGTKLDLSSRQVPYNLAARLAHQHGLSYFEVSSKIGTNVVDSFTFLAERIMLNHYGFLSDSSSTSFIPNPNLDNPNLDNPNLNNPNLNNPNLNLNLYHPNLNLNLYHPNLNLYHPNLNNPNLNNTNSNFVLYHPNLNNPNLNSTGSNVVLYHPNLNNTNPNSVVHQYHYIDPNNPNIYNFNNLNTINSDVTNGTNTNLNLDSNKNRYNNSNNNSNSNNKNNYHKEYDKSNENNKTIIKTEATGLINNKKKYCC